MACSANVAHTVWWDTQAYCSTRHTFYNPTWSWEEEKQTQTYAGAPWSAFWQQWCILWQYQSLLLTGKLDWWSKPWRNKKTKTERMTKLWMRAWPWIQLHLLLLLLPQDCCDGGKPGKLCLCMCEQGTECTLFDNLLGHFTDFSKNVTEVNSIKSRSSWRVWLYD